MTDFNKGDFTQQGVDGHVNAKVRLNAKRYLNIDLTSDEDASGCTISGHVYDSLNDITYPIGSAPSGNIEITENTAEGEPLDISQYATATVNVAGGGASFPMCKVTFINELGEGYPTSVYNYLTAGEIISNGIVLENGPVTETSDIFDFLYRFNDDPSDLYFVGFISDSEIATNLVNCRIVESGDWQNAVEIVDITADSSLTITAQPENNEVG